MPSSVARSISMSGHSVMVAMRATTGRWSFRTTGRAFTVANVRAGVLIYDSPGSALMGWDVGNRAYGFDLSRSLRTDDPETFPDCSCVTSRMLGRSGQRRARCRAGGFNVFGGIGSLGASVVIGCQLDPGCA